MSCAGSESIHVSSNVARAKTGYLRRFNKGFFSDKWKQEYFVLYVDSTLAWFDDQGSYEPKGGILLKDVCQYMAVGVTTQYIPGGLPRLPPGAEVTNLIAVPKTRSKSAEFVWILCTDQNELNSWLQAISNVLPPPPQPPQQPPPQQQGGGYPPPHGPPPYGGQPGYPPPPNQGYPPPPQHAYGRPPPRPHPAHGHPQTVVINQGGRRGSGGGRDFATGMLIGGALGYGMGRPWGWGWGMGYGYGFGSGISINNHYDIDHTHIENNTFEQNNYDYGDGDYGGGGYDGDFGGGDFGGGDFGGGDFGGDDFGGGDFGGDFGD